MALEAGSCGTVDADGVATGGSGYALHLWNNVVKPKLLDNLPNGDTKAALVPGYKDICEAFATYSLSYLTANGEVTVKVATSDTGLQRTPNPNDPDTNTQGPSALKTLVTKGTIG